ncbi:MAG: MFS transporter [Verrucomicrobiota bacterium]|nr:MFS transporter [Verrucomicrobiota bacterium]
MSSNDASGSGLKLTRTQWLICIIATIGFLFDIYELLMLPLVAKSALLDMAGIKPGTPEFLTWVGRLFFIPAIVGGIFGLMGGWFTDQFGRRKVLTFSILLYAFAAFCAGFCVNPWQLLFFRCLVFIGVCVEFVAAVAWLAELFPNIVQREKILGYTQAFSSVGGLTVAIVNGWLASLAIQGSLPAINELGIPGWGVITGVFGSILGQIPETSESVWRLTLMSGLIPAIPLIIIRPFLPESPQWQKKKDAGELKRASIRELFSPQLCKTTIIATILFALAYGAAFGSLQQMRLIIPETPQVVEAAKTAGKKASAAATESGKPDKAVKIAGVKAAKGAEQIAAAKVTKVQEVGGLYGRAIMALLVITIIARGTTNVWAFVGWTQLAFFLVLEGMAGFQGSLNEHFIRAGKGLVFGGVIGVPVWFICSNIIRTMKGAPSGKVLRLFQLPGMIIIPLTFAFLITNSLNAAYIGMFLCGFLVVGQFTFWGNMLPKLFPIHLRGTGESFAANIGGRLLGTSFAWISTTIAAATFWPDDFTVSKKMAYTAAGVGLFVFALGWVVAGQLPEPQFTDHEDEGEKIDSSEDDEIEEEETTAPVFDLDLDEDANTASGEEEKI